MKKSSKTTKPKVNVAAEMIFTLFVAAVLSGILWAALAFTVVNIIQYDSEEHGGLGSHLHWVSAASYILFGLVVGYRARALNVLGLAPKNS